MKLTTLTLAAVMAATSASAYGVIVFDYHLYVGEDGQYVNEAGSFSSFPEEQSCRSVHEKMQDRFEGRVTSISWDRLGAANWTRVHENGHTILSSCMETDRILDFSF